MARTNIVGTLTLPDGSLYSGSLFVSWGSIPWQAADGTLIPAGPPVEFKIKNGVVDIELQPTDGSTVPTGIQYQAVYRPTGAEAVTQYLDVPTSVSPVALESVIVPAGNSPVSVNYLPLAGGMMTGPLRLATQPPANAGSAGSTGTITWDSSFFYICVSTNTWKRVAIATW
jgi:hypothetical protein